MASPNERFSDLGKAEIHKLQKEKDSKNTKKSKKLFTAISKEYLCEKPQKYAENSEEVYCAFCITNNNK